MPYRYKSVPATFQADIVARHSGRHSPATFQGISVARHLRLHSPATFRGISVARHLRLSLSGDISGRYHRPALRPALSGDISGHFRCPSPPAGTLQRRFGAFPLPDTSGRHSPATFQGISVARHLRLSLSGNVSGRYRRPSLLVAFLSLPGLIRRREPRT